VSLPKERISDPDIREKAIHMLRRHPPEYVSDYLGMCLGQVRTIYRTMPMERKRGRPLKRERAA
jgi:hypothetical protein